MAKLQQREVICQVCKKHKKLSEVLSAEIVRAPIVEKIMTTHPDWSSPGFICGCFPVFVPVDGDHRGHEEHDRGDHRDRDGEHGDHH